MTNPPEEVLRQLSPEERVLWHARPRFRQLRRRARLLAILTLIACLLAWMGHHSTGTSCPEGWILCYLLLLALPLSELIGTLWYLFTPGAALPLVYLDNPASARIALPWEMYNEFMWAILFLLLSLSAGIYVLTTYLRAHRNLKHLPNS